MSNARPSLLALSLACTFLVTGEIGGQTPQLTQVKPAPAAAPPPPAGPVVPPPPLPIGTPIEQLPRFEVDSVKKFEGRVTSTALRTPGGGRITIVALPLRTDSISLAS